MLTYQMTTLSNGVRILSEHIPAMSSAALGIWVHTGSRDEDAGENGAAHFIEHMLFKGSDACPAAHLAARMDAIGGQVNAFTMREMTCFYARALQAHLGEALDILSEMFFRPRFDEGDVQTERGVILEEIGMYEDDPADLVSEQLGSAIYQGSSLARPILGTRETLEPMTGEWLREYKRIHYVPERIVISIAGCFDDAILEELSRRFSTLEPLPASTHAPAVYQPAFALRQKDTEQNHLILAFPGIREGDPRRFAAQLLSSALGGGMSSRLFQEVRERQGLCYNIYSYGSCYEDTGLFGVYTALSRDQEGDAVAAIRRVLADFAQNGVTQEELNRVRELSKANVLMGLESTTAHMNHLAQGILQEEGILAPEEIIARYDSVTREDVLALARDIFDWSRLSFSAVGQVSEEAAYREMLFRPL